LRDELRQNQSTMLTIENVIPKDMLDVKGYVKLYEGPSVEDLKDVPPVNIIQRDQTMYVHFHWKQHGWLGRLISNCTWKASVFLEQIGKGEVDNPAPVNVSFQQASPAYYRGVVTLPANSLPEGAFRVVATLTLQGPSGPTPIAAFDDLGIVQVYED